MENTIFMEKYKAFAKKFYLKEIGLIFFVSLLLFLFFFAKQDVYLIDVSREAYIPWQMLKGQVLYKDIFNVYGPLGYQINALAYAVFGIHLNTLYFLGFLNSLVILFTTFYISKLFVNKQTALCITGLTLFVCVYAKNFFNFIFVYSYNAVYALSGFLLSLLAMLFYIRDKKNLYLVLSFFFAGFAFANKIEYLPYFGFIFLCLPFFVKKDWKQYLYAFGSFMLMPVISFSILFLQGVSLKDLLEASILIKKLVNAPVTNYFYYNFGLYFNPEMLKNGLSVLLSMLKTAVPYAIVLYLLNWFMFKREVHKFVKFLLNAFIVLCSFTIIVKNFSPLYNYYEGIFAWMGIAVLAVTVILSVYCGVEFLKEKRTFCISDVHDRMYVFLLLSSILVSVKGLFSIFITCYGTFNLAALFIPFVIFFVNYVPRAFKLIDKEVFTNVVINLCVAVMLAFLTVSVYRIGESNFNLVKQPRGMIFMRNLYGKQNTLIKYIRENTSKDAKIVTVPEGAMINFLAERDTDNYYYYLIPVNVQIFGAEKIVNDFKKNPPDYFLMNDLRYTVYGLDDFCSYTKGACEFIKENYTPVYKDTAPVSFTLYKYKYTQK